MCRELVLVVQKHKYWWRPSMSRKNLQRKYEFSGWKEAFPCCEKPTPLQIKTLLLKLLQARRAKAMFDLPKCTYSPGLSWGRAGGGGLGLCRDRATTVGGLRWSLPAETKGKGHLGSLHRASPQAISSHLMWSNEQQLCGQRWAVLTGHLGLRGGCLVFLGWRRHLHASLLSWRVHLIDRSGQAGGITD